MPTYEFRCPEGHEFEKFYRSISGAPYELACPVCGKTGERLMSAGAGLVFKGSGFYITDYGKDGKKSQTSSDSKKSETSGGSESETSSSSKTESSAKPDAPSSDAKPAQETKPAASTAPDKSASTGKKKASE
jgi:putative FmdB family regulatory protein